MEKLYDLNQDGTDDVKISIDDGDVTVTILDGQFGVVVRRVIFAVSSTIAGLAALLFSL